MVIPDSKIIEILFLRSCQFRALIRSWLTDPAHNYVLICVQRLATSAYKPARLGKSSLLGLSRRSGQTYPLVAD